MATKIVRDTNTLAIDLSGLDPRMDEDTLLLSIPRIGLNFSDLIQDMRNLGLSEPQISTQLEKTAKDIKLTVVSNMLVDRIE